MQDPYRNQKARRSIWKPKCNQLIGSVPLSPRESPRLRNAVRRRRREILTRCTFHPRTEGRDIRKWGEETTDEDAWMGPSLSCGDRVSSGPLSRDDSLPSFVGPWVDCGAGKYAWALRKLHRWCRLITKTGRLTPVFHSILVHKHAKLLILYVQYLQECDCFKFFTQKGCRKSTIIENLRRQWSMTIITCHHFSFSFSWKIKEVKVF